MVKVTFNLLKVRRDKNLKQTELSKITGLSQKALSELETGKSKGISFETMAKLCEALKISPQELFEISSENNLESTSMTVVEKPSCSFCSKKEQEVEVLIVGKQKQGKPQVYICSECIKQCNKLLDDSIKKKDGS